MERKTVKTLLILGGLVALTLTFLAIFLLMPPDNLAQGPLPNPNGYQTFLEAGNQLTPEQRAHYFTEYAGMAREDLVRLVEQNTNAVQLVRVGLQQECRVPIQFSEPWAASHPNELVRFKWLSQALAAEAALAMKDGRTNDAARCYLDVVRLAAESARGGVVITALICLSIERNGTTQLQNLAGDLDAKSCREIAATLETVEAKRESWQQIQQQERHWVHRTYDLRHRLMALLTHRFLKKAYAKGEKKFQDQQLNTRRLMLDLAAHAYELEKGYRPKTVADLVPEYLKTVPNDPVTGADLTVTP